MSDIVEITNTADVILSLSNVLKIPRAREKFIKIFDTTGNCQCRTIILELTGAEFETRRCEIARQYIGNQLPDELFDYITKFVTPYRISEELFGEAVAKDVMVKCITSHHKYEQYKTKSSEYAVGLVSFMEDSDVNTRQIVNTIHECRQLLIECEAEHKDMMTQLCDILDRCEFD